MNRRQLAFIIVVNGLISLVIALIVVWVFEIRRSESQELGGLYDIRPGAVLAATPPPAEPVVEAVANGGEDQPLGLAADNPPAPTQVAAEQQVYVVRGGDSLVAIATRYNVSVDDIVRANNLANPDFVFSGQQLIIPGSVVTGGASTATPITVAGVEIAAINGVGNPESETVQIVNDSDQAYTLQGWQLARVDGPSYTFGNVPLFPGGSVRVNTRAGENTSIDLYWGQSEAQWQSGAVAQLLDDRGAQIHTYTVP
ncbi:MAG: LysM peptidoglycan-binding domain-containing protein [Caldilineaceae bacterium]